MEYGALIDELRKGHAAPTIFLYGEESYRIDSIIRCAVETVVDPGMRDFNLAIFDAEETEADHVISIASSYPMMSERRLVIVKGVQYFSLSEKEQLQQYAEKPVGSTCLLMVLNSADKKTQFTGAMKRLCTWVECKPLYENQAAKWVMELGLEKGVHISPDAAACLVEQVGTSQWSLFNEVEKLITYASGKQKLTVQDVYAVAGLSRHHTVWNLITHVMDKDLNQTLTVMQKLIEAGQNAIPIVSALAKELETHLSLLAMKADGASEVQLRAALKIPPFLAGKVLSKLDRYSFDELENAVELLTQADFLLKTGRYRPEVVLTLAFYQMIRSGGRRGGIFN